MLHAVDGQKYDFSFFLGTVFPDAKTHLDLQQIIGAELQFNDFGSYFIPEVQLLQSLETDYIDYPGGDSAPPHAYDGSTFLTRLAIGGVHDFNIGTPWWIPFFKTGLGYETLNDYRYFKNEDSLFFEAGGGLKYYTSHRFALKVQALYLKKLNTARFDDNVGLFFGFSYELGGRTHKEKRIERNRLRAHRREVADTEISKELANPEQHASFNRPPSARQAAAMISLYDRDRDGVPDSLDRCPDTPKGLNVERNGCARIPKFVFAFAPKSADIRSKAILRLNALIAKLAKNKKRIRIIGYADDMESTLANTVLAQRRAKAITGYFIAKGIDASRIETVARGQTVPPPARNRARIGRRVVVDVLE